MSLLPGAHPLIYCKKKKKKKKSQSSARECQNKLLNVVTESGVRGKEVQLSKALVLLFKIHSPEEQFCTEQ